MRILITNDDGITSPGLRLLVEKAKKYAEVWVVAPDGQRSAASHSYSFHNSVTIEDYDYNDDEVHAYSCSGSPVDCVRIGIIKLMPEKPDYVFSGINNGYNMSWDIQYSATVSAALEASFLKVQSIAFSMGSTDHMEVVEKYIDELIEECMSKPLKSNQTWSINFPACDMSEFGGIRRDCVVSTDDLYADDYKVEDIGGGVKIYSLDLKRNFNATEGTDLAAIIGNCISVGVVNNIS